VAKAERSAVVAGAGRVENGEIRIQRGTSSGEHGAIRAGSKRQVPQAEKSAAERASSAERGDIRGEHGARSVEHGDIREQHRALSVDHRAICV